MPTEEKERMLSARVPESLFRRVQVYRAMADISVQEFVRAAVEDYLDQHEPDMTKRRRP